MRILAALFLVAISSFIYSQPVLADVVPFTRSGGALILTGFALLVAVGTTLFGVCIGRWLARR